MKRLILLLMLLIGVNAIGQITNASYTNKGATVPVINSSSYKLDGVTLDSANTVKRGFFTKYQYTILSGLTVIKPPTINNTLFGLQSGNAITSGTNNAFFGYRAGYSVTSGVQNTFIGHYSGNSSTANQRATHVGYQSGYGSRALDNVFIGANSGYGARLGNNNTAIGSSSGHSVYDGAGNIFIGYKAGFNEGGSNKLYIENSDADSTNALIFGNFSTNMLTINGTIKTSTYLMQQGIYAGIYVADASAAQSIANGTTYTKSTAFTTNGNSANCTSDAANDKITITKTGKYLVNGTCSFSSGTSNVVWKGCAFLNGVEQSNIHWARKVGSSGDVGSASFMGTINVTSVPVDLDMRFRHDQGSATNITVQYSNLTVIYLGE